jgi:hypothetical protein
VSEEKLNSVGKFLYRKEHLLANGTSHDAQNYHASENVGHRQQLWAAPSTKGRHAATQQSVRSDHTASLVLTIEDANESSGRTIAVSVLKFTG